VKVLGLDIATRTGWCRYDGSEYVTGMLDVSPEARDEPEGARFLRFRRGIHYLLADVDAVVIERTFSKGSRTAEILNGLTAIALAEIEERGLEYAFVGASTLKAFGRRHGCDLATDRGLKEEMRREAMAKLDCPLTTDESDAWWLVRYWREHLRAVA
jgi:hypothetical protein